MVKFIAWAFALLNIAPLLWMVWSSLLGSNEILQGKVFPDPYSNDVVFFESVRNKGLVAATLHGQIYRYPENRLSGRDRMSMDLHAVSVNYTFSDTALYAFSPDEGLMQVDLSRMEVSRKWNWSDFERSFRKMDFTPFGYVQNQIPEGEFFRLGALLDTVPLIADSGWTLAKICHTEFPRDSSLVDSLNAVLFSPKRLKDVLSVWRKKTDWVNPVIAGLFDKERRSAQEDRELFRWCLAERIPTSLTRFRQIPWNSIWVDHVPASDHGVSVVGVGNRLCVGMWWESFPGIAVVDREDPEGKIHWITVQDGLPSSSVQSLLRISDNELLVVHDQGFSLVDVQREKVKANYLFGESGLPFYNGRDLRISLVSRSAMLFASGREIVFFDFRAGRAIKRLFGSDRLFQSDISALKNAGDFVYFGSSNGISEMYLWDLLNEETDPRRIFANRSSSNNSNGASGAVTTSLSLSGNTLLAGSQGGTLTEIDLETSKIADEDRLPQGGIHLHWRNYEDLWRTIPFGTLLSNSLIICCSTVLICLVLGSLAGYAMARMRFRRRRLLNVGLLWSLVVPNILYLIPAFLIVSYLQLFTPVHLLNTKLGIILVYSAILLPMATWILRNFFRAVPREIEEAALIDGCTPISSFFRIVVPSALPGIVATGVYIFILAWDELMFAWVFSMDLSTATIPVGMRLFFGQFGNRFDLMMAAATLATIPVVVLFFLMQRSLLFGISNNTADVRSVSKPKAG